MWIKYLLIVVEVIVGLLLIGVVLLQRSKDQGLGLAFGAGMGESLFGSQAVNVLIKITIVLSCVFFLNTMFLARLMRSQGSSLRAVPAAEQRRDGGSAKQGVPAGKAQPASTLPTPAGGLELPATTEPFVPAAPTPAGGTDPVGSIPAPVAPVVPVAPVPVVP